MRFGAVLKLWSARLVAVAVLAACASFSWASETDPSVRWASSSSDFKVQLHALAAEALMLQIRSASITTLPSASKRVTRLLRAARRDGETRLADSLRAANALLSMLEIAEHSDRGDRVRQVLLLWLESNRISLADHLKIAGSVPSGASVDAETAAFLEELKIVWRRLDDAYKTLETLLRS